MPETIASQYFEGPLELCGKLHGQVAAMLGYERPDNISMSAHGHSPIPLERAVAIAAAVNADRRHFVCLVLGSSAPEAYSAIRHYVGELISAGGRELILLVRGA